MTALPVLGMWAAVLFPGMQGDILLSTGRAQAAVRASIECQYGGRVAMFATRKGASSDPEPENLYTVGTLGQLVCLKRCRCCGRWMAVLRGVARIRVVEYVQSEPFREAHVEVLTETQGEDALLQALASELHRAVVRIHACRPRWQRATQARAALETCPTPAELPGCVADLLAQLPVSDRQALLETEPLAARLEAVLAHAHGLLAHVSRHSPGHELHQ